MYSRISCKTPFVQVPGILDIIWNDIGNITSPVRGSRMATCTLCRLITIDYLYNTM